MARMINKRTKKVVVTHLEEAKTLKSRIVGLIGRKQLNSGHGLLIYSSGNSIHTFFMKFAIDLVFIDRKGRVRYTKENLKPWRIMVAPLLGNTDCLELPSQTLSSMDIKTGDELYVEA